MKPILIVVSTFNRPDLTGLALDSIKRSKSPQSDVLIIDDASTAYDKQWLRRWGFAVEVSATSVGVGAAAQRRFTRFVETGYAFICAIDNDVLVCRYFDQRLFSLFCRTDDRHITLVSGYRSVTQQVLDQRYDYVRTSTIGGICQFTDRVTTEKVLRAMAGKWEHTWDAHISAIASKMIAPRQSWIQHTGIYGTGTNGVSEDVAVDFVGDGL